MTFPIKLPLPGGAKVTVAEVESPECKVRGRARLPRVKPAPLSVAWLRVRSLPPVLERVTVAFLLEPAATLPKVTGDGVGERTPAATASPVAESETTVCEFRSSKAMVTVGSPAAAAVKVTLKAAVCPAAKTVGMVMPVTWKPEPKPATEATVTEDEVLFEIELFRVTLLPMATAPKFRLAFATATAPCGCDPPVKPPHPARISRLAARAREATHRSI